MAMLMSGLPLAPFPLLVTNYNGNTGTTGVEQDLPEDVGMVAPVCLHLSLCGPHELGVGHHRAALVQITRPQVQGCTHEGQLGKLISRSLVRSGQ